MKQMRLKIRQSLRRRLIASDYCYRVLQSCPLPGRSQQQQQPTTILCRCHEIWEP